MAEVNWNLINDATGVNTDKSALFKKDKNITYSTNSIGWGNRLKRSISNLKPKTRYVFENKKGGFYPA